MIRGTFLGVPMMRIIVFWGLNGAFPIYGNYRIAGSRILRRLNHDASYPYSWLVGKKGISYTGTI